MKRGRVWLRVIIAAALAAGGWWGYRMYHAHVVTARSLPARPGLADRPAVLVESVAIAEARAQGWSHSRDGLVELSRLYHANGFFPEAITCYEGLSQLEPGNPRWLHLRASIIANFGQMDEALPLREQVVKLAPSYIPGRLRLGDVLLKTNRSEDAARVYAEVLSRVPGEPYALLGLARCALVKNDWAKAKAHLETAIAQHPDFIGAISLMVTVSEHLGDAATAEAMRSAMAGGVFTDLPDPWIDELSEVCYDDYLLSVAASVANFASNRAVALELINRAIGLAPEVISYRRQAGQYYLQDSNFGAAKVQLEKALAINPADSDCWLRYLDALRGLNQPQAVVAAMRNGLAQCPQSSGLHLEYARWLKSVNRLDEAITEFRRGYELRPTEASPLVELATTYLTAGRVNDAVESLNQALERQPEHPGALATLALIEINNHNEAEARRRFQQLRRQAKAPPELLNNLVQAFQQQFGRAP
ncbi:MAG: tetratricopeptide repeat protein [Opitutus sp.]